MHRQTYAEAHAAAENQQAACEESSQCCNVEHLDCTQNIICMTDDHELLMLVDNLYK